MKKIAVLFPGIGYTCDKPLLYYSAKLAQNAGYEIRRVNYTGFPQKVRGDRKKMEQSFVMADEQAEQILSDVDWTAYDEILFLSKSVGTICAGAYAARHQLRVRSVLYTPVADTFRYVQPDSVIFHGTSDPWVETPIIMEKSEEAGIPVHLTPNANHSLETGDVESDLKEMAHIMKLTEEFIKKGSDQKPV